MTKKVAVFALGSLALIALLPFQNFSLYQTVDPNLPTIEIDFMGLAPNPLLKTKLGLAQNMNDWDVRAAIDYMVENTSQVDDGKNSLGLTQYCGAIEFQYFHRQAYPDKNGVVQPGNTLVDGFWQGISSVADLSWSPLGKPLVQDVKPRDYLIGKVGYRGLEDVLYENNIRPLFQVMGAPAQYQFNSIPKIAEMRPPTEIPEAASFMGQWMDKANHRGPILWSIWNEPGHSLAGIENGKRSNGTCILGTLSDGSCQLESSGAFQARERASRDESSALINEIYASYEAASRGSRQTADQFGMASFLGGDFNNANLTTDDMIYYKKVTEMFMTKKAVDKNLSLDFVSFNSFGGQWDRALEGARSVSANALPATKFYLTQYNPPIIERDAVNVACLTSITGPCESCDVNSPLYHPDVCTNVRGDASAVQVAIHRLNDISLFIKQPDLDTACMSAMAGGQYGFLGISGNGAVTEKPSYKLLKMYMSMPVIRRPTKITPLTTSVVTEVELDKYDYNLNKGVHVLASSNSKAAGILLWNDSLTAKSVNLKAKNLDASLRIDLDSNYFYSMKIKSLKPDPQNVNSSIDSESTPTLSSPRAAHQSLQMKIEPFEVVLITYERSELSLGLDTNSLKRRKSMAALDFTKAAQFEKYDLVTSTIRTSVATGLMAGSGAQINLHVPNGEYGSFDPVRNVAYLGLPFDTEYYSPRLTQFPRNRFLPTNRDFAKEARLKIYFKDFDSIGNKLSINYTVLTGAATPVDFTKSSGEVIFKINLINNNQSIASKEYTAKGLNGTSKLPNLGSGKPIDFDLATVFSGVPAFSTWKNSANKKVMFEVAIRNIGKGAQAEVFFSSSTQNQWQRLVSAGN